MALYVVVACGRCRGLLLAKAEHKTRTCPYCGFKVELSKTVKLASAETAESASALLRKLKASRRLSVAKPSKRPLGTPSRRCRAV